MSILWINACMRKQSRTLVLAESVMKEMRGEIIEEDLNREEIAPLNDVLLEKRDRLIREEKWDDPMLRYARQFAEADEIVIAAPFWDLSFPREAQDLSRSDHRCGDHIPLSGWHAGRTVQGEPPDLCHHVGRSDLR